MNTNEPTLEEEEQENARNRTLDALRNAAYHALKAGFTPQTIHTEINFIVRELDELDDLNKQRYDWAMHERDVAQQRAEQAEARIAKALADLTQGTT